LQLLNTRIVLIASNNSINRAHMVNCINADGIAVDWISDKLYFHDWCNLHIGVLDLASNLQKILANDTNVHHRIYYSNIHIVVDPMTR
jgi:UDP-N-acetyl-D-mannosaminuronic acid transferase (WecB/TagA/CpsF family)